MWGMAADLDRDYLIRTNSHLLQPDLAFLFHGKRFMKSIESGHVHEQNAELADKAVAACEELADLFQWKRIFANLPMEEVAENIWKEIVPLLHQNSS